MIAANDQTDAIVRDKWYEGMWKHYASRPIGGATLSVEG